MLVWFHHRASSANFGFDDIRIISLAID